MTKVGISKIGFVEQNEVDDEWVQVVVQQQQERGGSLLATLANMHIFKSVDQSMSEINEKSTINENGHVFDIDVSFVVRQQPDIDLGKKYLNRPLVLCVWTVDGGQYTIGTKSYPVHFESENRYENTTTRELALTVRYQSVTSLLK